MIGRDRELAELAAALDRARAGRGGLVLLTGAAGIGKTTVARALAEHAAASDVTTLWSLCDADAGAPAYWPWIQLVRGLARAVGPAQLAAALGARAEFVAALLPGLADALGVAPGATARAPGQRPEQLRFALFDTLTSLFAAAARARPLLLVIDDLHTAGLPSLRLLEHVARHAHDHALLLVGAVRDGEGRLRQSAPALDAVAANAAAVLPLGAFTVDDVTRFIASAAGRTAEARLAEYVTAHTGGHPLFVDAVVRALVADDALSDPGRVEATPLPGRLRAVLRQRLDALSSPTRDAVVGAAVIGERFALSLLAAALGAAPDAVRTRLAEAQTRGLIELETPELGRYRFQHGLLREGVYDLVPESDRAARHLRVADALERPAGERPTADVADLSHHFFHALPVGPADKAVHYATEAGRRELAGLAWEAAAVQLQRALDVLTAQGDDDPARRAELLILSARARRDDMPWGRQAFFEAAAIARRSARWDLLADAALGVGGDWTLTAGAVDDEARALLEEAAERLGERDAACKARLLARLAFLRSGDRGRALAAQAVTVARRSSDREALAQALAARSTTSCWSYDLDGLRAAAAELVEAGRAAGSWDLQAQGLAFRAWFAMLAGELSEMDQAQAAQQRLAEQTRLPWPAWLVTLWRAMRSLLACRFDDAEADIERARAIASAAGIPDGLVACDAQRYFVARERGGVVAYRAAVEGWSTRFQGLPVINLWMGHLASEVGDLETVKAALAPYQEKSALVTDQTRPAVLATLGQMAAAAGDVARAQLVYDALVGDETRVAMAGYACAVLDLQGRVLGALAEVLGRLDEAVAHFEQALTVGQALGAWSHVARTEVDCARAPAARGPGRRGACSGADRVRGGCGAALRADPGRRGGRRAGADTERGTGAASGASDARPDGGARVRAARARRRRLDRPVPRPHRAGQSHEGVTLPEAPARPAADPGARAHARSRGRRGRSRRGSGRR